MAMIRRPNTSHRLVNTGNRLLRSLVLLSARLLQHVRFHQHLVLLQVSHADRALAAVDVVAFDNRMFARTWGDADFDLRVCGGEGAEVVDEELAVTEKLMIAPRTVHLFLASPDFEIMKCLRRKLAEELVVWERCAWECSLHASGASGPVAVVEIKPLALQDERADSVLLYSVNC